MFDVYFPEINCSELLQTLPDIMPLYSRNNVLLLRVVTGANYPSILTLNVTKLHLKHPS